MPTSSEALRALLAELASEGGTPQAHPRYSIYLKNQLEFNIDRAPVDETERLRWCTIHPDEKTRIYSVVFRYSYCFPIFSPYAVRTRFVANRGKQPTEEDDTVVYDGAGKATSLSRRDIAWILGMDADNCRAAIRRLQAKGALRVDLSGRCFATAKPQVPPGERPARPVRTSEERQQGLAKDVARRLERQFAPLPEEVRTDLLSRAFKVRTDFLDDLKKLRYREKKGYDDLCTEARNLISSQSKSSDARTSSSSDLGDSKANSTTTENGTGPATTDAPATGYTQPVSEFQDFQEGLIGIFVNAGKPAPTHKQVATAAAALPPEARLPYLDHLQSKIGKVLHPGVLESDVAAYAASWPKERERLHRLQAEAEADRLREQERGNREVAERDRWVREELLADRYADPEEVIRVLEQNPRLRDYKPPSEHFHAMDVRHVRQALYEIQRPNCTPAIKQEQRRRLKELEQIWPGIVDEFKHSSATADDAFRYDAQHRHPQGEPLACSAKVGEG